MSIFMENPEEKDFYTKIAAPITETELKFMTTFGIGNNTGFIDMKEYIILTIVRVGEFVGQLLHWLACDSNLTISKLLPYRVDTAGCYSEN